MLFPGIWRWGALAVALTLTGCVPAALPSPTPTNPPPAPEPTPDRLAAPTLPPDPSPEQIGASLYYTHCMPCHGDRGQGLTDEWREVWVEDHQNCWKGGCHSGRAREEGFPIPTVVPPAYGQGTLTAHFPDAEALFAYLSTTHPPQRPGALTADEYRALTAFLLQEEGGATAP
jgi:mono/diheme cytochrome c family protein